MRTLRQATILGTGIHLPEKRLTNFDLEKMVDTSDEWIVTRSGIRERRLVEPHQKTSDIAVLAAEMALRNSGIRPEQIGAVMLASFTPDRPISATSAIIAHRLGCKNAAACDIEVACSGFVYGLVTARGLLATGMRRILLVGVDTLSRITDWEDRRTAIIFADGAGAVVLEATDGEDNLLGYDVGSDGAAEGILRADLGGYLRMDGKEVFRRAVDAMVGSCGRTLERAGRTTADVDLVVPHQANARIIEAGLDGLSIPRERASMVIETVGNTSAASVPLALAAALDQGRIHDGDDVLFVGFGAGMAWASALLRWQG